MQDEVKGQVEDRLGFSGRKTD